MQEGRGRSRGVAFGPYLTRWLETLETLGSVAERTLQDRRYYAEKHLIPGLGDFPIEDLTAEDFYSLYASLTKKGTGPRTVNHVHETARVALQRAVKKRLIPYNPVKDADPPPYSTAQREYLTLSEDDVARFFEAAGGDRYEALWIVAVLSGMRPAELRGLRWSDVKLTESEASATIRYSSTELKGERPKLKGTKTGKHRVVPLLPAAVQALREHKARQNEERLRLGEMWEDNDLVFPSTTGTVVTRANLTSRHYKPILKKAGLDPAIRLYDLRHSMGTIWVDSGEEIATLSKILGHARVSTTADHYIHPSEKAKTDAMGRFGRRFGAGDGS